MYRYLKERWLQLWLFLVSIFKKKKMVVTQGNIDEAIQMATNTQIVIYKRVVAELKKGCEPCKEDFQLFTDLTNAIWLLTNQASLVERECITENDVWLQIQFIRENSCSLPYIPRVIVNTLNWLVTNTGLNILTNTNRKIITT